MCSERFLLPERDSGKNLSSLVRPLFGSTTIARGRDRQMLHTVAGLIVLPKEVLTEVTVEVAPHGVDVVGVVLRVVELDQEVGRLNAVVMRVALIDTARPSEVDIPTRLVHLCDPSFRQVVRHIAGVFFHESHERVELPGAHFGGWKTRGLSLKGSLPAGGGHDFLVRSWVYDCNFLLLFVECMDQFDAEVVFLSKGS